MYFVVYTFYVWFLYKYQHTKRPDFCSQYYIILVNIVPLFPFGNSNMKERGLCAVVMFGNTLKAIIANQ